MIVATTAAIAGAAGAAAARPVAAAAAGGRCGRVVRRAVRRHPHLPGRQAAYAARTGAFEHHLVVPGVAEGRDRNTVTSCRRPGRGDQRVPLPVGDAPSRETWCAISPRRRPDPRPVLGARASVTRTARAVGATGGRRSITDRSTSTPPPCPAPRRLGRPALRACFRRRVRGASTPSCPPCDTARDTGREADAAAALRPRPRLPTARGRTSAATTSSTRGAERARRASSTLLEAAARAREPWPLTLVGTGPRATRSRRMAGGWASPSASFVAVRVGPRGLARPTRGALRRDAGRPRDLRPRRARGRRPRRRASRAAPRHRRAWSGTSARPCGGRQPPACSPRSSAPARAARPAAAGPLATREPGRCSRPSSRDLEGWSE